MIPLNANLSNLKRSAIRVYTNLAKEVDDCVMLTIGEPDFDTPQAIKDAAVAALVDNQTHYAPNQGTAALRQAIANLPERERTVIQMRYFHGLTQDRVAKVMNVSQVQISRIEKKAIGQLRELMM